MKRSREEGSTVPQVKRPNAPRGDPCGETSMPPTATGSVDRRLTTNDALAYLKDVKGIFKDKKEKYDEFLEVMKDFKAQRIDTAGVIQRVKELFRGHRDLILGFNAFLPQGYEITMPNEEEIQQKKPVEFEEAMNFVNKIKTCFQNDERIYKTFLDILNMYRKESKSIAEVYQEVTLLFENHHDLLKEFTYFLPNHTGKSMLQERTSVHRHGQVDKTDNAHSDRDLCDRPGEAHQRHRKRAEKEKHKSEDKDRINHENDGKDLGRDSRDENMRRKRKSCQRVNYRVVEPMHTSGENTENFGIYSASDATHNNKNALKNESEKQFTFIERVKEKLNGDAYQEFLKYLHLYSKEMISRTELKKLVGDCLRSYPDLVDGIIKFLPSCESIESSLKGHFGGPVIMDRREKERESENEREKDRDNAKEINKERETPKDSADHKASSLAGEMCSWNKPISELDLSDCQRCTPSYRLLPKNYPLPPSTNRTEVGDAVLNDLWVSVTSGSEDYSFKHMRKNQYEESLFRCEDDRFELDMLLESVNTTTKRVEDLLKAMQDDLIKQESQIRLEDHFNALNLRCIERLYGDHGLDVMDVLRKNPGLALPVILTRLKQKQEEWSKCRADFNKVWAEIYAKNYHKSLDHRSFYFKQQDAKNLSTKVLLTEIKEVNEKKEKEDDILSAVSAGSRAAIPHMEFDYNDPNIHEDIYEIINYSCGEVCSSTDQMDKVLEIWTTFLEPMLGVPPRLLGPQDETKKQTVKSSFAAPGESCRISDVVAPSGNLQLNLFGGGSGSKRLEEASSFRRRLARDTIDCDAVDVHRAPCRTDKVCATSSCEKMPDDLLTSGDALGIGMRSVLTKQAADASATHFKHDQDVPEEAIVAQTNNEVLTSAFEENTKADRLREGHSIHGVGGEKEEGELSPAPDFEESNLEPMKEGTAEPHCLDRGGADDADTDNEGKESAQRSIEGSENASDAAEDALASDSGNGELCSQEGQGADEDAKHADHDGNTESEDEAEGIADARGTEGDGQSLTLHEHFPHTAKPLAKHVPRTLFDVEKCSRIFYGNDSFYVLFRLHQTLYERILSAKVNSSSAERKWGSSKESNRPGLYTKFMGALFSLLNGSADNTKFEDDCRSIIGTQSYVLFTLDKLIYKLVKQVRAIASDEMDNRLLQLYAYESSRRPGQFIDLAYQENAHVILNDDVIYRFECSSDPTPTHLSIQLVECGHEKSEMAAVSLSPNFASYLYNDFLSVIPSGRKTHSVFLRRNKRKNAGDDPYAATPRGSELTFLVNGLECKISCKSLKVSYVLDTEDLFYCKKRRISSHTSSSSAHDRVNSAPSVRVQSFHQFLSS